MVEKQILFIAGQGDSLSAFRYPRGEDQDIHTVEAGFRIILKDPNVKAILINIFGGIVRCDRVANGVVEAYKNIGEINVPIIVRLQGTNAEELTQRSSWLIPWCKTQDLRFCPRSHIAWFGNQRGT